MATLVDRITIDDISDPIEKIVIKILLDEGESMEIHTLYNKVVEFYPKGAYEFKFALSHLIANQIVNMNFDGNIEINQ